MHLSLGTSHLFSLLATLMAGLAVIALRMRGAGKPITIKKIIIPPLGMSTGFLMFIAPATHIPFTWGLAAFACGALLFSYPLIRTSKLHFADGQVVLKRSKMFIFIIVGLLLLRILMHDVVEAYVSIMQTGAVFFILAFGMILPWRLAMLREYRTLTRNK